MLALENALAKQRMPFKLKGLPPRVATNVRILGDTETRDPTMDAYSAVADSAQAIAIERRIKELRTSLIANGMPEDLAAAQADQMLGLVSRSVVEAIKDNRAAITDKKAAKEQAVTAITDKLDEINTGIARLQPGAIMGAATGSDSMLTADGTFFTADESGVRTPATEPEDAHPPLEEFINTTNPADFVRTDIPRVTKSYVKFRGKHEITVGSAAYNELLRLYALGLVNSTKTNEFSVAIHKYDKWDTPEAKTLIENAVTSKAGRNPIGAAQAKFENTPPKRERVPAAASEDTPNKTPGGKRPRRPRA